MSNMAKAGLVAGAVAAALAAGGCGEGDTARSGGPAKSDAKPRVLTLANANGGDEDLAYFADAVARESDGALRVKIVSGWRAGQRHYEQGVLRDVRAGKADLGWVGSRAMGKAGVQALDRKSTRLNSSHANISYAVFCLKKKQKIAAHVY